MPLGFGRCAMKSKGRPLSIMAHLKKNIVKVKAEDNFLANDLVKAISRLEKDPKYNSYRRGCRIRPVVRIVCETISVYLSNEAGIPEIYRYQKRFRDYKMVVYLALSCEDMVFEGQVDSSKRINLLYDGVEKHYHVIANLTANTA